MPYDEQQKYMKFLKKKCHEHDHSNNEGCEGCGGGCDENNECTCCPVGLVAVYDDQGKHQACLTPNDAELYNKNSFRCQDGYVKLYQIGTPNEFLGCVSEAEFATLYPIVNPPA